MISSRRLAREWALKVLYQVDVGGLSLPEASGAAFDRLRREFVQRGSRSGDGAGAAEICLRYLTEHIASWTPISDDQEQAAIAAACSS
ncbi:MAG TPA: hypothetical protein VGS41_18690, partial [Chthonomonadales bacterium]|nr:hypothetical protein [Chthonomonadales bacterium]